MASARIAANLYLRDWMMKKGLWVVAIGAVVGAGYLAGVALTGQQVDEQFAREVAAAQEHYRGVAMVSSSAKSSTFSSANTLTIEYLDLPESVVSWAGTNTVNLDVNFQHGFLSSQSVMQLSPGSLLDKLKSYQVNAQITPLVFNSEYRFDPLASAVIMNGVLAIDGFEVTDNEAVYKLGATSGPVSLSSDMYQMDLVTAASQFSSADVSVAIGVMSWSQKATAINGNILQAKSVQDMAASFNVEQIKVDAKGAAVDLDGLSVSVQQKLKEDRVVLAMQYGADSLVVDNAVDSFQLDQPELQLSFDLDYDSVMALVENLQQMQQANAGQIDNPMLLVPLFSEVTQKGVSFSIEKISAIADGEALDAVAKLNMAPFSVEEAMTNRQALMQKVDLNAKLTVPKKFLQAMPGYDSQQLGFFVAMGFLVDAGEYYDFKLAVQDGVVMLNDKKMPGL